MYYAQKHLSLDNITSILPPEPNITRLRNHHQAINDILTTNSDWFTEKTRRQQCIWFKNVSVLQNTKTGGSNIYHRVMEHV